MENTVLLIDDDKIFNTLNKRVLNKAGVKKIEITLNGKQGLDFLFDCIKNQDGSEHTPRMIFLDLNMPEMNGWEFLEEFERHQPLQELNIPIIILTASRNPDDAQKATHFNSVKEFLVKPLTPEKVQDLIHSYLNHSMA